MSYYSHPDSSNCCPSSTSSTATAELKLYQAFIFSVPIFFTFILLFLFYLFYLRRRRVDWASLRMRSSLQNNDLSRAEMGLKKELREMLPIIIYKESFSIKDTQCSVCLADYQAEDKLQQIPACGHAFHMDCIDHWLATHTTCPLCRLSLIPSPKAPNESPDIQEETSRESSAMENSDGASDQPTSEACEETQASEHSGLRDGNTGTAQNNSEEEERSPQLVDQGSEFRDTRDESKEHDHSRQITAGYHAHTITVKSQRCSLMPLRTPIIQAKPVE
ncbi:RING-H2 finger protein ATL7-like [Pistacia vera]|uniref:RING-H2 finger protein ATL7-like n=1 Tax=Pistacia vera TaxID=55513 RepID=UPI00126321A8|nr:RING-H2 finger protein ATL7-like [Pistacia vera]